MLALYATLTSNDLKLAVVRVEFMARSGQEAIVHRAFCTADRQQNITEALDLVSTYRFDEVLLYAVA